MSCDGWHKNLEKGRIGKEAVELYSGGPEAYCGRWDGRTDGEMGGDLVFMRDCFVNSCMTRWTVTAKKRR
jgi:hypothetical protein